MDLSNMGTVAIADENYEAPSEFFRPVDPTPAKETTMIIREGDPTLYENLTDFNTKEKIAGFSMNQRFKIVGGKQDGATFYAFIDTRKAKDRNGSKVQDYLVASGYQGRLVTLDDFKLAVQSHTGVASAIIGWEGQKCDICDKKTLKKTEDFKNFRADGSRNHVMPCPTCGEDIGARATILRFVVKKAVAE